MCDMLLLYSAFPHKGGRETQIILHDITILLLWYLGLPLLDNCHIIISFMRCYLSPWRNGPKDSGRPSMVSHYTLKTSLLLFLIGLIMQVAGNMLLIFNVLNSSQIGFLHYTNFRSATTLPCWCVDFCLAVDGISKSWQSHHPKGRIRDSGEARG